VPTNRDGHVTAGLTQLLSELHPGRRGPHHEDTTVGKRCGVAVLVGGELSDALVEILSPRRDARQVAPAGGEDDVAAPPRSDGGGDLEFSSDDAKVLDPGSFDDRGLEGLRVASEVVGEVRGGSEPVGVRALIPPARERVHPVRGQQPQRVPHAGAPALTDATPFEDHVIVTTAREEGGGGQPGLAASDDDGVGDVHGSSS
jgi:hypothetical protein